VLARHAESLFWAGRAIERAESTARMLDVTYHTHLEALGQTGAWEDLLKVLHLDSAYAATERPLRPLAVMEFLVSDPDNPGTISNTVLQARENLRSVRELISTEVWETVNAFHLRLRERNLADEVRYQPHALCSFIKSECQALAGTSISTMPRDEGWNFLMLGWMLERAIMTCRLIDARYSQVVVGGGFHHWLSTLKAASGSEAFRRTYLGSMAGEDVVEFLLVSRVFPRSVLFCLRASDRELSLVDGGMTARSRPRRLLGRLVADVDFVDVHELLATDIHEYLHVLENNIRQVSEAVTTTYFRNSQESHLTVVRQ
jgi:uncharacterized alpha-E superfamily protein